jgi:molecular chaperone DnaK (HSP70)
VAWNRLLAAAEACRIELSSATDATVHLPDLLQGRALGPLQVTRKEFETAAAHLLARVEAGIVSTLTHAAQFDKDRDTPLEVPRKRPFFCFRALPCRCWHA